MIQVKRFTFNPFQENTYVLYDESKDCIIIDPGCYDKTEQQQLKSWIAENGLAVKRLINTHCHIDHVFGNAFVKRTYDVTLTIHKKDLETLRAVKVYAPMYGIPNYEDTKAEEFIDEGHILPFGESALSIVFVPGHAPGHIALYNIEQNICIGGDVLFEGSIGRTDLPGGDFDTLIRSIHEKIFPLGDEMVIYPGHGPTTTVGHEKKSNPFCAIKEA